VQEVSDQVRRAEREQVARGLVLQLPERRVGVPEVEAPAQELARRDLEVQLGVERDPALVAEEVERQDQHVQGPTSGATVDAVTAR